MLLQFQVTAKRFSYTCVCVSSLSSEKNRMTLDLLKNGKDSMGRSHISHTKFSY